MALNHSPRIVTDNLLVAIDAGNPKCYSGSGLTLTDLAGNYNATSATSFATATDATAGTVADHNNSTKLTITLSTPINHESWSFMMMIRSIGVPTASWKGIIDIYDATQSFYRMDTREPTNHYLLGSQKDYTLSAWVTNAWNTEAEWELENWWCVGVSYDNGTITSYLNGEVDNTQTTETLTLTSFTDLEEIILNEEGPNTTYMGPFLFYEGVKSDAEFKQNFEAYRGRFGL